MSWIGQCIFGLFNRDAKVSFLDNIILSVQGESFSAATDTINPFKKELAEIMEEKGLALSQVFNCGETGLYWRLMPNKPQRSSDTNGMCKYVHP